MLRSRRLTVVFFRTLAGREPVREWLRSLPSHEQETIGTDIGYVQSRWPIGRPRVDHLRRGIWEVRSTLENRRARVLFAVHDEEIVLLHGFIKKTRSTPPEEISLAERRWKDWQGKRRE